MTDFANPYGTGNHRRISWRRKWDVDLNVMVARHTPTGFALVFTPRSDGGYSVRVLGYAASFGLNGADVVAEMAGFSQLMQDGWEIFHTVMDRHKRSNAT